jgi:hypothetical protein
MGLILTKILKRLIILVNIWEIDQKLKIDQKVECTYCYLRRAKSKYSIRKTNDKK